MEKFVYRPIGVCSQQLTIYYEGDIIDRIEVFGGCSGNLGGISALIKGMKLSEARDKLVGIHCGYRSTSCPDQLAKAIDCILAKK